MRIHALLLLLVLLVTGCATHPGAPDGSRSDTGDQVSRAALKMVGKPYRYGGTTPAGFDCSGLVFWAYGQLGITVPRTSRELRHAARSVDARALRRGDVLFFDTTSNGHVGIYVGNRQFVHAPSSGGRVQVAALDRGYYAGRLLQARRLLR
jgi:cell wall-associated NlpC family hydrolase